MGRCGNARDGYSRFGWAGDSLEGASRSSFLPQKTKPPCLYNVVAKCEERKGVFIANGRARKSVAKNALRTTGQTGEAQWEGTVARSGYENEEQEGGEVKRKVELKD